MRRASTLIRPVGRMLAVLGVACLALAPCIAFADGTLASDKGETVNVHATADGAVKDVEVSVLLKNGAGARELADVTNLTSVEGDDGQSFSTEGSMLVWTADGEDVSYTGTSSAELPIGMSVSYTLDGQPVSASELAGKSGHVVIRVDFENRSQAPATVNGSSQTVYTPFTCITALMLDGKRFSNVTVENAKVIEDGDDIIVAGYAMPGLKESLGPLADDASIPDHFTVSADVAGFELKSTMTIVTAGLMSDLDVEGLGLGDMDNVDALTSAMDQLIEGASKLTEGLGDLKDGAAAINEGAGALSQGMTSLSGGLYLLTYGSDDTPGLEGAAAGAASLSGALGELSAGLSKIADAETGLPAAATALTGLAAAYADEATTVDAAQAELQALLEAAGDAGLPHENLDKALLDAGTMAASIGQVAPGVQTASDNLKEASASLSAMALNAESLPQGLSMAVQAAEQLYGGALELEGYTEQLEDATGKLAEGAKAAAEGSQALGEGMSTFNDEGVSKLVSTLKNDYGGLLDRVNALSDAAKSYTNFSGITPGTTGSVKFIIETDPVKKENA